MGNFIEKISELPQKGKIYQIVDTSFTAGEGYPVNIFGQGTKVKIIGSKFLISSNPNAPKVMVSIIQFPNGSIDVYPSYNLKPV